MLRRSWPPLLVLLLLLGAWEAYVDLGGVDELILASPSQIARSLYEDRSLFFDNLATTAQEVGFGIVLSLAAGFALGVLLHWSDGIRRALYPLAVGSQAVPLVIFAPLLVFWLGFGILPKLVIIGSICFFPVTVTTYDALRAVDPELRKLMRTLDASRWQAFRLAELPAALPAALSGARIAVAVAVIGAFLAETSAGSTSGLGHLLMQASPALETARAFASGVVMAVLSVALFYALGLLERRVRR